MKKTKLLAVAAGFLAAAGLTTAGNIYIGGTQVGTFQGTGDIRLPGTPKTSDDSDNDTSISCSGSFNNQDGSSSTGCRCWAGYEYQGGGSQSEVPDGEDCTAVDTSSDDDGSGGSTTPSGDCGIVSGSWAQDNSLTEMSKVDSSETFKLRQNKYLAIRFVADGSRGKFAFDMHTHAKDAQKTVSISTCPGDFGKNLPEGACRKEGATLSMNYSGPSGFFYQCKLQEGQEYYLNVAYGTGSGNNLTNSCPESSCGAIMTKY